MYHGTMKFGVVFLTLLTIGCAVESPPRSTSGVSSPTAMASLAPIQTPSASVASHSDSLVLQLTYISERHEGYYGVYAVEVGCLDTQQPCIGTPHLMFELNHWLNDIAWSPDGRKLAFSYVGVAGDFDIFVANSNGQDIVNITNDYGDEGQPVWSSNGAQIAYIYGSATEPEQIRISDTDGKRATRFLDRIFNPSDFMWLPDGHTIAYTAFLSPQDGRTQISIAQSDGTVLYTVPNAPADFTSILGMTFSPDGKQIAFVGEITPSNGPSTMDIYVAKVNDGKALNLTNKLGHNMDPKWSPVGDWLAFESDRSGNYEVYLISSDGRITINVSQNESDDTNPAWLVYK